MNYEKLTICIPSLGCNKECLYCISKMTGFYNKANIDNFRSNINKIKILYLDISIFE